MSAPHYPQQMPPAAKKSTPIWVWLLVGFIGVGILVVIAAAAGIYWFTSKVAESGANPVTAIIRIAAAANPDVEVVSSDDKAGKITIRDKRNGKLITIGADDIKDGKIVLESDEGTAVIGGGKDIKPPAWVPLPPGAEIKGGMTGGAEGSNAGSIVFTSNMSVADLKAFYAQKTKEGGFEEKGTFTTSSGNEEGAHMTFENTARKRNLVVSFAKSPEGIGGNIAYSEQP